MQNFHTKSTYSRPKVDYTKKARPSQTVPQQALSIRDILSRFTRNIPVHVPIQTPVYVDQSDHDLEKLARMSFDDKVRYADELKAQNEQTAADLREANDEAIRAEKERRDAAQASYASQKADQKGGDGIVLP